MKSFDFYLLILYIAGIAIIIGVKLNLIMEALEKLIQISRG